MFENSQPTSRRGSSQARMGGILAERYVSAALERRGFKLLASQYAVPRLGELDLIFIKEQRLVIVEVKAREHQEHFGGGLGAITNAKLRRMAKTALHFAQKYDYMNSEIRFLAAEVALRAGKPWGNIHFEPIGMNDDMPQ